MIPIELRSLQQLTKLQLQEAGLVGTIPSNLAALPALQELYLGGNQLTGQIHRQFGTMSNLQVLDLSANQIAGSLTTQLGSLASLKTLNLSGNVIPGAIPVEIVSMPMLQELDMSNNQLVGSLPRLTGSSLVSVNVSGNPGVIGNFGTIFSGASETFVDFSCAQCSLQGDGIADSIQALNLEATGLTGPIGNLLNRLKFGNLLRLELGHNSLTGQIPNQLFSNQRLQAIRLNNNLLTGPIPSFANGATLQIVDLSNNPGLVGDTTAIFGSLQSSMTQFSCNNCTFSGPLSDAAVASLRNLETLELENAGVGGSLPAALGSLTGLTTLNLINNGLSGTIPQSLTSSSNIKKLLLAKNLLSASLTSFTGESLEILSLDENLAITGSLSVFFSTVSKTLAEFYCEKCSIPGTIPGQLLRELSNLRALKLEAVGLGGSLPAQFGVLSKLTSLELGGNSLVGSIPEAIADLPQLVKVELYDNQLVGDLLVFSSNSLQILNLVSIDFTCVEQ
jgi:Leucine-rich repeat (LRR) protein